MSQLKEEIFSLRKLGYTYSKIQQQLNCSRGTISFHLGKGVKDKAVLRNWRNKTNSVHQLKMLYGGSCKLCGYSKCLKALDFHHVNSSDKIFEISSSRGCIKKMAVEARKCILICANCHRELHSAEDSLIEVLSIPINYDI